MTLSKRASSHTKAPSGIAAPAAVPHYLGHRQRAREKFLKNPELLADYELLELLLFWIYPRQDTKPLAKDVLERLGGFAQALLTEDHRLSAEGFGSLRFLFHMVRETSRRLILNEIRSQELINNSEAVLRYCRLTMAHACVEQFRIFFLDKKYYLIADELQQTGTLDQTSLYPREVMKRALALNAAGLILVHNHPSGDPSPSNADKEITRELQAILPPFNITVLDHFIIGRYGYFSFRENNLIC